MPVCFSMTHESRAADIVEDASTMIVRPVPVTWSCKTCAKNVRGAKVWCLSPGGRQMLLTKSSACHGYWLVRCTLGERAVRFSFLAPFFRARPCAYIMRNSCMKLRVRARREAQGAGCREQGAQGEGEQGATAGHKGV